MSRTRHGPAGLGATAIRAGLVALLLAVPGATQAQSARERGEVLYKAGVLLFKAGKHREALSQFREAGALSPGPDVTWSMARCHEELSEWDSALAGFEAFAQAVREPDARAEAGRRIAAIRMKAFGRLRIEVSASGAAIEVDGATVGQSPLPGPVEVRAGTRHVAAARPGFVIAEAVVEVRAGEEASVAITLIPLPPPLPAAPAPTPAAEPPPVTSAASPASPPATTAPATTTPASPPPRAWSPMRAGLFFGGIAAAVAGGVIQVSGYAHYRRIGGDPDRSYDEQVRAYDTAGALYWTAYALYGAGAVAIVTSFLVPASGRHPLSVAPAPLPGGMAFAATLPW
ncbi:MAG: PEGA domain-containing protein [Deltaproteobacteria bacterium]|nr:PEGA domain-containing protein [Deltaproteobacteria bacterium]